MALLETKKSDRIPRKSMRRLSFCRLHPSTPPAGTFGQITVIIWGVQTVQTQNGRSVFILLEVRQANAEVNDLHYLTSH